MIHGKKKPKICNLLDSFLEDEEKASIDYRNAIDVAQHYDEELAEIIEDIRDDELDHANALKEKKKELGC